MLFREAPDYEGDEVRDTGWSRDEGTSCEAPDMSGAAGDNEYIVVVEVSSGEGERERKGGRGRSGCG